MVEEGTYPLETLLAAEEAFTSSSVREILPWVELDGRALRAWPRGGRAPAGVARARGHRLTTAAACADAGATLSAMETIRLGGMALQNGVLVHGPTAWGCAVRDEGGTLHVASGRKPRSAHR